MTNPAAPQAAPRPAPPAAPAQPSGSGQGKGRGRPKGAQPKNRPEIPDDLFTIKAVPEEERAALKRRREERSPKQQAVDNKVMDVYKEWKALGKPRVWGRMNVKVWPLPPNLVETAVFMLGKAAALHGLKLYYGQKGIIEDGAYQLSFCVVERRMKVEGAPEQ